MKKISIILIFTTLLIACGKKPNYEKSFTRVVGTGEHTFRAFDLGDTYENVLNKEEASIIDYTDSIQIRCKIEDSDTETYQITYVFDENAFLDAIRYDAYIGTIEDGAKLTNLFIAFFNKKYGATQEAKGFYTWTKNNQYVELSDDSEVFGYGKVSLNIYKQAESKESLPL